MSVINVLCEGTIVNSKESIENWIWSQYGIHLCILSDLTGMGGGGEVGVKIKCSGVSEYLTKFKSISFVICIIICVIMHDVIFLTLLPDM